MSAYYQQMIQGRTVAPYIVTSPGGGSGTPDYTIQDYRNYSVTVASTTGTMKITSASHPTSVTAKQQASWSLSAQAQGGSVNNPGIAYQYLNGPASSITLVQKSGTTGQVSPTYAVVLYFKGNQPVGTTLNSTDVFSGVIFPQAGTYTIQLLAGSLSDTFAATGGYTGVGNYYMAATSSFSIQSVGGSSPFSVGASIPLTITTQEAGVWDIAGLIGALSPFLVVGGAIFANEARRYK